MALWKLEAGRWQPSSCTYSRLVRLGEESGECERRRLSRLRGDLDRAPGEESFREERRFFSRPPSESEEDEESEEALRLRVRLLELSPELRLELRCEESPPLTPNNSLFFHSSSS